MNKENESPSVGVGGGNTTVFSKEKTIVLKVNPHGLFTLHDCVTLDDQLKVNFSTPNHDGRELGVMLQNLKEGDIIKIVYEEKIKNGEIIDV